MATPSDTQHIRPTSHASQKCRNLISDDLLLRGLHIQFPILEHRDRHLAVARVDDARLSGEVPRPAVIDVGSERVEVEVYTGEDEGEVGEFCASRCI